MSKHLKWLGPLLALLALAFAAFALGDTPTTGTNVSCATVSVPDHILGIDSRAVYTISGTTTANCNTKTYTIPTSTSTETTTVTPTTTNSTTTTPTTTSSTTTTPTTTSSSSSSSSTTSVAGCTVTDSTLAQVVSDSASQPDGSTICIAQGSYGSLTLSATRTSYITIKAANGYGHVTLSGLNLADSASFIHLDGLVVTANTQFGLPFNSNGAPHDIQVTNTDSEGFTINAGGKNYLFDHDSSHDGPYGWLLGGSQHPWPGGCCSTANYPTINNVTVENSTITSPQADAFQVKGFNGLTIKNNDIYNVVQNGNHNDGVQTVHGGYNLHIDHNVFRDGNVELFMIKDGSIEGTNDISNNLVINNSAGNNPPCGGCGTSVTGTVVGPVNFTIEKNSIVSTGLALDRLSNGGVNGNPDYLLPSNVLVDHNLIEQFRPNDYLQGNQEGIFTTAMTEHDNIWGTWTGNWMPLGTGDSYNNNPTFKCGASCGANQSLANDDYELATNPNGIGIDWNPASQTYGPH